MTIEELFERERKIITCLEKLVKENRGVINVDGLDDELFKHKNKLLNMINILEDTTQRAIFIAYYINGNTFSEISESVNYTEGMIFKIRKKAFVELSTRMDLFLFAPPSHP